jgi:hypothetical protein
MAPVWTYYTPYVRQLVAECDEVLERVVFHEQTWAQVAADLGLRLSTVQARVRRTHADLEVRLRRRRAAALLFPPR